MTEAARQLIEVFHALPDPDRREVLAALLRETVQGEYAAPSDDEFTSAAHEVFLELDFREPRA